MIEPNLISCERVAPGQQARNRNFTAVFGDRTSFRAKGLPPDNLQIAILFQLLAIEPHFVRKGCARK